jgi:hypothetical protein
VTYTPFDRSAEVHPAAPNRPGISTMRGRLPARSRLPRRRRTRGRPARWEPRRHPRTSTRREARRSTTRRRRPRRRTTGDRTRTSRSREASSRACRWGSFLWGASGSNWRTQGKCCPTGRRRPGWAWRSGRSSQYACAGVPAHGTDSAPSSSRAQPEGSPDPSRLTVMSGPASPIEPPRRRPR